MGADFTLDQKLYLEGFVSGAKAVQIARGAAPATAAQPVAEMTGPDAASHRAMARTEAEGRKLTPEEKAKREELGLDAYDRMRAAAREGTFPKGPDVLRWKYHGLFYVAPAQDSFMCRMRIPGGILTHWQFRGVADIAERHGGGFTDITTRANLQIREIPPTDGIAVLEGLVSLGLTAKGSGADNIRNVTGTPTAGIDRQELLDTRPLASAWHHYILNSRDMYGLPRKFNVAFDGAGAIGALEDTNDIGFQAVEVMDGFGIAPGIWLRLVLGGITGHKDFARDTGIVVRPEEAVDVAAAIVRAFIDTGDRTDRKKARLKYVLDSLGFDGFLKLVEAKLGRPFTRLAAEAVKPRAEPDRLAHLGVHPQKQAGLNYVGVATPVGRMSAAQMRGLADISARFGDGDIRLTVWQNLLISGVADVDIVAVTGAVEALGLTTKASPLQAGIVACTGAKGCRFAAADTKGTARAILAHCEERIALDGPVNIHVTGCHNSCAQHYIGDIGLIGARVPVNDDGDTVDGYHILVGGGFGSAAAIARELYQNVAAEDAPAVVERLLKSWVTHRAAGESFADFTRRLDPEALKALAAAA
ncbi:ferredoxin-nitrite reductase [Xanthobacter flavus]|uniref:Ferredoxin--nitrite reductase n=1 Tax=Xanthobacter flavus TaxID=281 RepID=A0A9W6CF77_XANFL|nr:NirA family protein [Xanthobacter flavus]MDR6332976.1 ferredoxin-nitrite reductase [Xanthobacter flavus]GLI21253.1 ferredoxin--nitrite reductase [Xanthobacter flavus]